MVGVRKVIIDCFGHAHHTHFVAAFDRALVNLVGGILGVVSPGVKEITDVMGLKDLEQAIHVLGSFLGLFLEIELVAASAERSGGSVFQTFDGLRLLFVE